MTINWCTIFAVAVSLSSCDATSPTPTTIKSALDESWSTGCQPDQLDPYGKRIENAKCWAMVSNFARSNEGTSIGVATIFEVSKKGALLTSNHDLDGDLCDEKPTRIAVDGKRIDQLAMKDRIDAVLNGKRLTREKDRGWPYCNVYNETTTIDGARAAYQEMMEKWSVFKVDK
ncbi:hypothetical protein ACQZ6V_10725 [Agrobacterium sp. 22-3674b3]